MYKLVLSLVLLMVFSLPTWASFTDEYTYLMSDKVDYSSPTWADVNGDGYLDLIGACDDVNDVNSNSIYGRVYCLDVKNKVKLWDFTPSPSSVIYSSPAVGNVDNDSDVEIVFGVGDGIGGNSQPGALYILANDGSVKWKFNTLDFDNNGTLDGIFSSPALGDLDRDGILDIVVASFDQRIYAFHFNTGTLSYEKMWSFMMGDTVFSSPALANIDDDPYLEVIIGIPLHWEDSSNNTDFPFDVRYDGGMLLVLTHDGIMHPSFRNKPFPLNEQPKTYVSQTVRSSPAVGDIDNDGYFEIVHATSAWRGGFHGRCGPTAITPVPAPKVYAWKNDGSLLWASNDLGDLPSNACDGSVVYDSETSPALGNLDADPYLEIVVGQRVVSGSAKVFILDGLNGSFDNSFVLYDHFGHTAQSSVGIRANPSIANVDDDTTPEILIGNLNDIMVLNINGYDGGTYSAVKSYLDTGGQITYSAPAVFDFAGDNHNYVGISRRFSGASYGKLSAFKSSFTIPQNNKDPWPMFHQNQYHTGLYDPVAPAPINDLTITKTSDTTGILEWTATGDNGNIGCAFSYEIRFKEGFSFDWDTATVVSSVPLPAKSGNYQFKNISGLTVDKNYIFAIKVSDAAKNVSEISNLASIIDMVPSISSGFIIFLMLIFAGIFIFIAKKSKSVFYQN